MISRLVLHVRGNAIAYVALFVALSGTAFAASQLPKNSVGSKQLRKNAVTAAKIKKNAVNGAKVKDDSLTGSDIKESTLGTVPRATNADNAVNADRLDGIDSAVFGRTKIYAGVNFDPRDPSLATTRKYIGTGAIQCNGAFQEFTTHLDLPQGATITSVDFGFVDNNAGNTPSMDITAYDSLNQGGLSSVSLISLAAPAGSDPAR